SSVATIVYVTGTTRMDADSASELHRAVARVDEIHARAYRRFNAPEPGSRAAADATIPHARWVITYAGLAVGSAADHILAWKLVADGGLIPIYAPMTLLRGALEAAVTARWLVDLRPTAEERVGRGIAAQLA